MSGKSTFPSFHHGDDKAGAREAFAPGCPCVWKTRRFVIKCAKANAKFPYYRGDIMEGKVQLEITYCVP